jgi:hypothetical protein
LLLPIPCERYMKSWLPLFLTVTFGLPLIAVASDPEPTAAPNLDSQKTAMQKLAFLSGTWAGQGWTVGPKGRTEFRQTEDIRVLQDGLLLSIEGRGFPKSGDPGGKPAFQANALVSFNDGDGAYRFYSFAQGRSGTFPAELVDEHVLRWSPGPVRLTIRVDPRGHWHETGEAPDGKGGFRQFFEMDLDHVP